MMNEVGTRQGSFRNLIAFLFKRKSAILLFFAGTILTASLITVISDPLYEVESELLLSLGRESIYLPPTLDVNPYSSPIENLVHEEQINSEIEILTSRTLAEQVVNEVGVDAVLGKQRSGAGVVGMTTNRQKSEVKRLHKAAAKFEKSLSVTRITRSNVISISFRHTDPGVAAMAVNELIKLYQELHLKVHKMPQAQKFFRDQAVLFKEKLVQAEEELRVYKKRHAVISPEEERRLLLQQRAAVFSGLNETLSLSAETQSRYSEFRQHLSKMPRMLDKEQELAHSSNLNDALETRLVELQIKEKNLLNKYSTQSRLVKNVRQDIATVNNALAAHEKKRYVSTRLGLNETYQVFEEEILRNQAELEALKAKESQQTRQLEDFQDKLDRLGLIEIKLNQLKQQVEAKRKSYAIYLSRFEESKMSEAMDTAKMTNVNVIQMAQVPTEPVSPSLALNLVLAIFLGLTGGLMLAFLLEYADDSLERPEDVEDALSLPVLACVPLMQKK